MEPLAKTLLGATGVLPYLGGWIGDLVPKMLHTAGLEVGSLQVSSKNDEELSDYVQQQIEKSKAALSENQIEEDNGDPLAEKLIHLADDDFDGLCGYMSTAEQSLRRLETPIERKAACPGHTNELMHLVRPNEIKMPDFENVDID